MNTTGFQQSFQVRDPKMGDPNRYQRAENTNVTLEGRLNGITGDAWKQYTAKQFSALTKAGLEDVDWRVPRVNYCKDSKYNEELPPKARQAIGEAKAKDGKILE